ncbi:hypothetical protein evm_001799 [Chilo suppressalis]|nr:hypothetical protein evm_001799 [Chilo suppressalis]
MSACSRNDYRVRRRGLFTLLFLASHMVNEVSATMSVDQWQRTILGHNFSVSRAQYNLSREGDCNVMTGVRSWLYAHEDAQVMVASVLVVVGLWWLVRAVLTLVINLVCPLLVVLLAVVCVPQLRAPLHEINQVSAHVRRKRYLITKYKHWI